MGNYVRADQTPFTSAAECSSYAAAGGVLTEPQSDYAPRTLCEEMGYTFEDGVTGEGSGYASYFRCRNPAGYIGLDNHARYAQDPEVIAACSAFRDDAQILPGGFVGGEELWGSECTAYTGS